MKAKRKNRKKQTLIITPFIDVIFILILFFIVTSNTEVKNAININLPKSSTAFGFKKSEIIISLTADGQVFVNEKSYAISFLGKILSDFDKSQIVTIEADENSTNGNVVLLFDILKKSGFSEVNLRTK